ncbi:MAG TPA: serine/threonine-protein kinase [Polyangia bacterium]|nr:serine/threonine-protein kinase [Polyangia bacterium]
MADAVPDALTDPLVGKVLSNRYKILRKLGEGAMAAVYLAEHSGVGSQIVLKVLLPDLADNQNAVGRFLQEAKIASEIHHDNVIDIFYSGRSPEGQVFLAMEYLKGSSLLGLIDHDGPMPWPRAKPILLQICAALEAAHGQGVVHRDVKPENVLVVNRQNAEGDWIEFVKVVDFGIANVGGNIGPQGICGTPEYMPPEQARALPPDPRDDVYAFGCLMYHVLTGTVPFTAATIQQVLIMHMRQPVEPPRSRKPDLDIPTGAQAVVMRALAKRREDRFQSMREVAEAIEAVKQVRRMTAPVRTIGPAATTRGQPERIIFPATEKPRRPGRQIALGALIVALFSAAAYLRHKPVEPPGRIEIFTSPDDAEVFVDGKKLADRSPLILDAVAGLYTVVARRTGYESRSRVFTLPSGIVARVTLTLPLSDATPVELVSDPPGALVTIDGAPWLIDGTPARTPFSISTLPQGTHVVEMTGPPEVGSWRGEIGLRAGTSYVVRGVLSKADAAAPNAPAPTPPAAHHHEHAAPATASKKDQGPVAATGGATGAEATGGSTGIESGAAVEKPYRPPPDAGILFLDMQHEPTK